jgi:hypothetical protein
LVALYDGSKTGKLVEKQVLDDEKIKVKFHVKHYETGNLTYVEA